MKTVVLLAALVAASPALGQDAGEPLATSDHRLRTVIYDANAVVTLSVAPSYQLTVLFAGGEKIGSVAVGDSNAWQVTASKSGDSLFIKPISSFVRTNMTVITDTRVYLFDLVPGSSVDSAYIVRFVYPTMSTQIDVPSAQAPGTYRLGGRRSLRPASIEDDGRRTFINWSDASAMPAVFGIGPSGEETLVDGYMRAGRFTIDRVYRRLVFRLDRQSASATRK